jgi:hypothetical protein
VLRDDDNGLLMTMHLSNILGCHSNHQVHELELKDFDRADDPDVD